MTEKRWLVAALVLLACAALARSLIFDVVRVRTASMEPNVREGAVLLTSRLGDAAVGDIVAVDLGDGVVHIKRLVAEGPGEVELAEGHLYVNGVAAWSEDRPLAWVDGQCRERTELGTVEGDRVVVAGGEHERVVLAAGEVWLLGDSRRSSHDSRQWGAVASSSIVGVVAGVAWPGPPCDSAP